MSWTSQPEVTSSERARLAVIGAGAWGTVLAALLCDAGHEVRLWTRREAHADALRRTRENPYLPGLALDPALRVTSDPQGATDGVEIALIAVPSQGLHEALGKLPPLPALVSCTKGMEVGTFKRFSEVIEDYQPAAAVAALSGPNLASEIAAGKPAAATVASRVEALSQRVQHLFGGGRFRLYTSRDIVGVEVAGALKNVVALAAGMCDGLELGDNAKATIITRGLAEIVRLGTHLGGEPRTFYGLAGIGDMVATCASARSRNHTAGVRVARGVPLADIEASGLTAEGIPTVKAVRDYALSHALDLPIAGEVYRVIFERKSPQGAIRDLLAREMKAE